MYYRRRNHHFKKYLWNQQGDGIIPLENITGGVTENVFDLTQDNGKPDYMRIGVPIQDSHSSAIADNHFFAPGEKQNDHVHGL